MSTVPARPSQDLGQGEPGLVSIIIPTYKRTVELRRAVESALAQTYSQVEVIVVADGPDPEARAALGGLDERMRYFELERNSGPAAARNRGVQMSRGEWLTFLDDDDTMMSEKTARQIALADRNFPERMISCRVLYCQNGHESPHPARPIGPDEDIADYILRRPGLLQRPGVLTLQAMLIHRSILAAVPFHSHKDHEDWAWLMEAWHWAGARIEFIWEPLVVYNIATEAISRSRRTNWQDSLAWAQEYRAWIGDRAYASFLSTKVALKAKRAADWSALRLVTREVRSVRAGWLEWLFLAGMWMLPNSVIHLAWKRSLARMGSA